MDEPTNHLDVETVEALGKSLKVFKVCAIFYGTCWILSVHFEIAEIELELFWQEDFISLVRRQFVFSTANKMGVNFAVSPLDLRVFQRLRKVQKFVSFSGRCGDCFTRREAY